VINDHIATPSAIFDEFLPCGVRHGIPADMSIIIFRSSAIRHRRT